MSKHNAYREFPDNDTFVVMSTTEYNNRWRRFSVGDRKKRYKLIARIRRVAREILTNKQWEVIRLVYFTSRVRKSYIRDIARRRGIRYSIFKKRLRNAQDRMKRYFKSNDHLIIRWRKDINAREG